MLISLRRSLNYLYQYLGKHLNTIDSKIRAAGQVDLASLCYFRIVFGLFSILFFWQRYDWIGTVPQTFFKPPVFSLTALFSAFPPAVFFQIIDIATGLCTLTVMVGLATRASTILLLLLVLVGNSFYFSLGFINHEILYLCVLITMCFQDWGALFSVDALLEGRSLSRMSLSKEERERETAGRTTNLWLLVVFIVFGFFTAGFGKAFSWVDFDLTTSGFLSWFYRGYFNLGRDQFLAPLVFKINVPLIWELLDLSAVIFELGFLFAIFSRKSWYSWLAIACFFHLMNCLLLNISFIANAVAYLAFVPWSQFAILQASRKRLKWGLAALSAFGAMAFTLRLSSMDNAGVAIYLVEQMGGDRLWTTVGIWLGSLLIFLSSFGYFMQARVAGAEALAPGQKQAAGKKREDVVVSR